MPSRTPRRLAISLSVRPPTPLAAQDHSLQLVAKEGKAGWVREEALASIQDAAFLPLPSAAAESSVSERPSFAFAIPSLVASVQRRFAEAKASPGPGAAATAGPPPLFADAYGTRQVVIVRTATSKVFGLHSTDGSVIWSHFVPPTTAGGMAPTIHSTIISGHGTSPKLLIVAQDNGSYRVRTVHPFTGKLLGEDTHEGRVLHAARLPYEGPSGGQPIMVADDLLRIQIFPKGQESREIVEAHSDEIFFYILEEDVGR